MTKTLPVASNAVAKHRVAIYVMSICALLKEDEWRTFAGRDHVVDIILLKVLLDGRKGNVRDRSRMTVAGQGMVLSRFGGHCGESLN
jgi:hypothetical protein